jgi:thioredoxin-related protein
MKYLVLILLACMSLSVSAQQDSLKVYERFPDVPPFKITRLPDSTQFSKSDLQKKTATLIMVFSPDCEHCQHATEDLLKHIDLFKKVQVIMATPLEYRFIEPFYTHYKIADYPGIVIGRDPTNFLGSFFGIKNFPSLFLYDRKGKFVQAFEGSVSFEKIASFL